MSIYDEKIQFVANLISFKLEERKSTQGKSTEIDVNKADFKDDITERDLITIFFALKNKNCIKDFHMTDFENDGEEIDGKWIPYSQIAHEFPNSCPGMFVVTVHKDFEKRYNKAFKKKDTKKIVPLNLPENTTWEDITIKFKNDYDVEICVKDKLLKTVNNIDFGCYKSNKSDEHDNSDTQWKFLQQLSASEGKFNLDSLTDIKEKDKYRQWKKKLSNNLREYFNIEDDPFYDYKENELYQIKFNIIPIPDLRGDGELYGIQDETVDFIKEEGEEKEMSHKIKHTHNNNYDDDDINY